MAYFNGVKRLPSTVYYVDSQISSVQWTINSLNVQLQNKQENLARLKHALSQLLNSEGEFHYNRSICLEPSLSKKTWNGNMANEFDLFKQRELQGSYQTIKEVDLQTVISRVEAEIEKIKQEIFSLESSRVSQQSRLNDLYSQRRRELLK